MKKEYDFSKAIKNPYINGSKKQINITISNDVLDYFKNMAVETGIPYQNLISLYLADCATKKKKI